MLILVYNDFLRHQDATILLKLIHDITKIKREHKHITVVKIYADRPNSRRYHIFILDGP